MVRTLYVYRPTPNSYTRWPSLRRRCDGKLSGNVASCKLATGQKVVNVISLQPSVSWYGTQFPCLVMTFENHCTQLP